MKIKWIILFSTILCFGCLAKKEITEQSKTAPVDFQLVWEDDFNGSAIDTTKWSRIKEGAPDWKNYMTTDDQVYEVSDGYLHLKGLVNPDTQTDPRPYLTGGVWTRDKFNFTYGRWKYVLKWNQHREVGQQSGYSVEQMITVGLIMVK